MLLLIVLILGLLAYGIVENYLHQKNLAKISHRIHVNGIRGKSTTTRLIASALREGGFGVLAKTTGTLPMLIMPTGEEALLKRKQFVSILEQLRVVKVGVKQGIDVLVVECMGVSPETQWVLEHRLIRSEIGVITNVRADHLDVMGSNLEEIAHSLARTIPRQGQLVTGEKTYLPLLQSLAAKEGTKVHQAEGVSLTQAELSGFTGPVFPENIAIALQVSLLLGLDRKTALRGMAKAKADPGVFRIWKAPYSSKTIFFVNALAANDRTSTETAWETWLKQKEGSCESEPLSIGLFNNRSDRGFRIAEMAEFCQTAKFDQIIIIGEAKHLVRQRFKRAGIGKETLFKPQGRFSPEKLLSQIEKSTPKQQIVLFAFGNIKGDGWIVMDYFERNGEELNHVNFPCNRDRHDTQLSVH